MRSAEYDKWTGEQGYLFMCVHPYCIVEVSEWLVSPERYLKKKTGSVFVPGSTVVQYRAVTDISR